MATTIVTKSGSGAPTASDLVAGELAVDLTNKRLYTEDSGGTVLEVGSNPYNFTANHDGSAKLATTATGIDVTGIVDASDLVRFGVNNSEIANNYVRFKPTGAAYIDHSVVGQNINFRLSNASSLDKTPLVISPTGIDVTGSVTADGLTFGSNNRIQGTGGLFIGGSTATVFEVGAGTEKMRLTSTGLGIGTSSPSATLEVNGVPNATIQPSNAIIKMNSSGGNGLYMGNVGASSYASYIQAAFVSADSPNVNYKLLLQPNGGNVGIGTSSPAQKLHIGGTGFSYLRTTSTSYGGTGFDIGQHTGGSIYLNNRDNTPIIFQTNNTERMRIDASGNLLVGKTTTGLADAGFEVQSSGQITANQANAPAAKFNRLTNDGEIIRLHKDGTTVGSIGTSNSDLVIGTGTANLWFDDGANRFNPASSITLGASDGVISFGSSGRRFKDIYLSGGVRNVNGDGFNVGTSGGEPILMPADTSGVLNGQGSLGLPSYRWKDLYLSGGVYLGGTGAANKLDDYEEGTWTPTLDSGTNITYQAQTGQLYESWKYVHLHANLWLVIAFCSSVLAVGLPFNILFEKLVCDSCRYTSLLGAKATL